MLAVIVVVVLFILLALAVVLTAMRGTRRAATAAARVNTRGGRVGFAALIAIVYLGVGIAVPLLLLTGNHSSASAHVGSLSLTPAEKTGRELFGQHCGVCHTLAGANATGKVGPNLDELHPSAQIVLHTIQNGCLQVTTSNSPETCLGYGVMPANVVQGKSAQQVAQFVAKVAGRE